jgi:hypothetical protein
MDYPIPRIFMVTLLQEHNEFARGLPKLVQSGAWDEADYVTAIMQTDLAEIGHVPPGNVWPRPGEEAPVGWSIYKAALDWCHGGFGGRAR